MSPQQALENLYAAVRQINATAEVHERLRQCAEILSVHLNPVEVKVDDTPKPE